MQKTSKNFELSTWGFCFVLIKGEKLHQKRGHDGTNHHVIKLEFTCRKEEDLTPQFYMGMVLFHKTTPFFLIISSNSKLLFRYPQTLYDKWNLARYKVKVNHFFKRLQRNCGGGSSDELCQKRCRHVNPTCLQPDVRCTMCL